jgi:hypothetical protein
MTAADWWRLKGSTAELRGGAFAGRLDVSHPELGLKANAADSNFFVGNILCVRRCDDSLDSGHPHDCRPWPLADSYVRGADLVATYNPTSDWPFSPQIYWRINPSDPSPRLSSLSLLVSVQTHLLETWPRISIESQVPSEEILLVSTHTNDGGDTHRLSPGKHVLRPAASPQCIVRRIAGADVSYAEIMPPSDFRELQLSWNADGSCHAAWSLFADFLEKGVIWRARLQSLLLTRANDVELARAHCQAIDQRPLPLTT